MKLAIVGSRTFTDKNLFNDGLNKFIEKHGKPDLIVSGGAKGADTLGENYAKENNIPTQIFYPNWKKYGKKAGILRNKDIVDNCTHILAFPSKNGVGTQDTIRKGEVTNKEMMVFYID